MTRRNVLLDGELPPPGETERFVEIPKGNDRMFAVELRNRDRVRRGTATVCAGARSLRQSGRATQAYPDPERQ